MIKEVDQANLSALKEATVSVLLVYMPGCQACEMAKKPYQQFSETYGNINFFQADLNKIMEFYTQYADTQDTVVPETDDKGTPVQDAAGNILTKVLLDDLGVPVKSPKIVAPMFYVFVKEEQSPENEYGHCGGIDGADLQGLQGVLEALNRAG